MRDSFATIARIPALAITTAFVVALAGCGQKKLSRPEYPGLEFKNVDEAPEVLRRAADAIVLIDTPTSSGTGTWVSKDGLLLTNNHVLGLSGSGQCAREGCQIRITEDYQLGSEPRSGKVFAEPLGVQPEFDVTLYQVWMDATKQRKFFSPNFLTVRKVAAKDLRKTDLHVIGHPMAGVKKWSAGKVIRQVGKWAITSHFILPGSSGSPILNNAGDVVGIIHRQRMNPGDHSKRGPVFEAIGSASADFQSLLSSPAKIDRFFSVTADHTAKDVVENERAYLLAGVAQAKLEGGTTQPVVEILAQACDVGLKVEFFASPEAMNQSTVACRSVVDWLEALNQEFSRYRVSAELEPIWESRLQSYRSLLKRFNAPLGQWIFLPTGLNGDRSKDQRRADSLKEYLAQESPEMSFELAYYIFKAGGSAMPYEEATSFVRGYRQQPFYQYYYLAISQSLIFLNARGVIPFAELEQNLVEILNDEAISVGDKLDVESILYQKRLL